MQTGFYRANLDLAVEPALKGQKEQQLFTLIKQQNGCGIIYVTLQKTAENIAQDLKKRGRCRCLPRRFRCATQSTDPTTVYAK